MRRPHAEDIIAAFSSPAPDRPRRDCLALSPFAWLPAVSTRHMLWTTNFHPVVAGEVYRSSQPSPAVIAQLQKQYGIKTIINLRGDNSGRSWYDKEVAQARNSTSITSISACLPAGN